MKLNWLRYIAAALFTLMNFAGAFKESSGMGFGSDNIFLDYTFQTVMGIMFCFGGVFIFSGSAERKLMLRRMFALRIIFVFALYLTLNCLFLGSPIGWNKVTYYLMFSLPACLVFVALANNQNYLKAFLSFICIFAVLLTAIAFIYKTPNPFMFLQTRDASALSWTYIQYGALATSGGLVFFVWALEKKANIFSKLIYIGLSFMCFMGTIYSGERGSILFVPIILVFYLIYSGKTIRITSKHFIWLILIIIVGLISIPKFIESDKAQLFKNRVEKLGLGSSSQAEKDIRVDVNSKYFQGFFRGLSVNPVFGLGVGNYFGPNLGGYPHNLVLEVSGELGLMGLVIYGGCFYFFYRGFKKIKGEWDDSNVYGFFVIFLLYFFRTLKTGDIASSRYFWILLAFGISCSVLRQVRQIRIKRPNEDLNHT